MSTLLIVGVVALVVVLGMGKECSECGGDMSLWGNRPIGSGHRSNCPTEGGEQRGE